MQLEETITISAQEKWADSDSTFRGKMLALIGWPTCYATSSWKKLPHMIKVNLEMRTWTK